MHTVFTIIHSLKYTMKNVSLIVSAVLALAVVGLYVLYFSGNKSNKTDENKSSGSAETIVSGDIAFIRVDSLINGYDMYHDLRVEFEAKAKKMETEFTAKGRSFQKEYTDFQEKIEKGLLTRSQAEQLQQQLARRQEDLERTSNEMRNELAEQEGVMLRQIQESMMKYIEEYNSNGKYSLIISTSAMNTTLLYGNPGMDITEEIKKGLNEEYIKNRPAKPAAGK